MNFDLRRPCKSCPFRTDVAPYLTGPRVREITDALIVNQSTFSCHNTNEFDEEDGAPIETAKTQHCAGALIMLERLERPNQMMRIAERFRSYDRTRLDMDAPVYATAAAMIAAQPKRGR